MSAVPQRQESIPRILLVEDNAADAALLVFLLESDGYAGTIDWVKDGEEALSYLFRRGAHEKALPPDLIILDLNLPKVNGIDILKSLREDSLTRGLPVIVMTTSSSDRDVKASYELGVRSFFTKPKDLVEYESLVKRILSSELRANQS